MWVLKRLMPSCWHEQPEYNIHFFAILKLQKCFMTLHLFYSVEVMKFIEDGQWQFSCISIVTSVVYSLVAVVQGLFTKS